MKLKLIAKFSPEQMSTISDEYKYILPMQLSQIEDGSCIEIKIDDTLDFISNRNSTLITCIQKLRTKGIISLSGIDIVEISKYVLSGRLTIDEASTMLYNSRQSIDNLYKLIVLLQNGGFNIIEKRLINTTYYIKAEKK